MSKQYTIVEGGMHDRFHHSMSKVQFVGGGFGNGKTAAACVKALRLCKDYPGCNGLIARSTYPKLNDTIRKEFLKWCPTKWIKRMPTKDDNTLVLKNGSTVNFRYVAQRGKETEEAKSNLLSATYDWIVVDQIEDPEFIHKDFMDLLGRLRGDSSYVGDNPDMPRSGPRWLIITSNPTRNWVYRELVRPLHNFHKGVYDPKLLCEVDDEGQPILYDGRVKPIIELFEGSTYENEENVGKDYIRTMLATYSGSMRDRFVFGKWGALSGLVYPQFNDMVHVIDHDDVGGYIRELKMAGYYPNWIEGYDHGIASASCYLLAFTDDDGNVFIVDGFYKTECEIHDMADQINRIRTLYDIDPKRCSPIYADPSIFRRQGQGGRVTGTVVSDLFGELGITMQRGANDIAGGIGKVQQYLAIDPRHEHPLYGSPGSPYLFCSSKNQFWINEITEYYWKQGTAGDLEDKPRDINDHAMDTTKYLLTSRPRLAKFTGKPDSPPAWMAWHEIERNNNQNKQARYR